MTLQSVSSSVTVERFDMYDLFTGSQEDLIAEGIANKDMFPIYPKRMKSHHGPDIPRDQQWEVRRIRGGRFRVMLEHEYRQAEKPPIDAEFLRGLVDANDRALNVLIETVRGELEGNPEGYYLGNSDEIVKQVYRLRELMRSGPVVKKCRFSVIQGGLEGDS